MTSFPQQGITQTIILNQSDILQLHSVPKVICPPETGYINIFQRAVLNYTYKNNPFTNVDNVISFKLLPEIGDSIIVSNSLNGINILGLTQSASSIFSSANPYLGNMSQCDNAPIVVSIANANPIGGDQGSMLSITITYCIFML